MYLLDFRFVKLWLHNPVYLCWERAKGDRDGRKESDRSHNEVWPTQSHECPTEEFHHLWLFSRWDNKFKTQSGETATMMRGRHLCLGVWLPLWECTSPFRKPRVSCFSPSSTDVCSCLGQPSHCPSLQGSRNVWVKHIQAFLDIPLSHSWFLH